MAVVTKKSGPITNRDASPRVLNDASVEGGRIMHAVGTIETNGDDSSGSVYIMCQIPSNARVLDVKLSCDGNNTSGAMDIGIYQTTENSNTVVDADFFASAQAIGSALTKSSVIHESGVYGIEDVEKPLWQALGLTADSRRDYDVACTITTADDAADTITVEVLYAF